MPRLTLTGAALACFLLAGAAQAGDATCLWKAMPQAKRDTYLKAFADTGVDALNGLTSDVDMLTAMAIACKVDNAHAVDAGEAFGAYALKLGTSSVLRDRFGVPEQRLQATWAALSPVQRKLFTDSVAARYATKTGTFDAGAPAAMSDALGLSDAGARQMVLLYLVGTVRQADREKLF